MSPRTGRPTTNPKKNDTRIRMTDEEVQMLEFCCKETGKTKTDIIALGVRKVYDEVTQKK